MRPQQSKRKNTRCEQATRDKQGAQVPQPRVLQPRFSAANAPANSNRSDAENWPDQRERRQNDFER